MLPPAVTSTCKQFWIPMKKKVYFCSVLSYISLVFEKKNLASVILAGYYYLYMLIIIE